MQDPGAGEDQATQRGTAPRQHAVMRDEVRRDHQLTANEVRRECDHGLRPPGWAPLRGCSSGRRTCPLALTLITERIRLADATRARSRRSARWPRRCCARRLPHRSAHYVATTAGDPVRPAGVPGCRPPMTGTARPRKVRPQRMGLRQTGWRFRRLRPDPIQSCGLSCGRPRVFLAAWAGESGAS